MAPSQPNQPIRVLVVDDSAVMRTLLSDLLNADPAIEVIGTARNGAEGLERVHELDPDVVTLDIEMPKMDGLTTLQYIMAEHPVPVIMVSAMDKRQSDITMKALNLGAVDFIPKPSGTISLDIDKLESTIIAKIKAVAGVRFERRPHKHVQVPHHTKRRSWRRSKQRVIVIGASTGGPKALPEVLGPLPRDLPAPILIVQHMPKGFTRSFADRLNWITSLEVKEAEEGDRLQPGLALIAPGNWHMVLTDNTIHLDDGPRIHNVRPSVDITMKSVAERVAAHTIGVLLTGMGSDGAEGLKAIKAANGTTFAQDRKSCVVYGMPKAAVELRVVDHVLPLKDLPAAIIQALG